MSNKIPLSKPFIHGNEWDYIKECLDTGWISSVGGYIDRFEGDLAQLVQSKHAVAVSSGTAGLHVALKLVDVRDGDEVIAPTVTFIASINAIHYCGAHPVFMDCDQFYNIDIEKTIEFITNETEMRDGFSMNKNTNRCIKAIVPVHVFGNAVALSALMDICRQRNIKIVEDATEGLGTFYDSGPLAERYVGSIGDVSCLSFNGNKIITTGGGGAIMTNDDELAKQARYLIAQAKDDDALYIHNEVGYNYRLNNIQAALGVAQLEGLQDAIKQKKENFKNYAQIFERVDGLHLAEVPSYACNNYWMYALQVDSQEFGCTKDELIEYLTEHDIESRSLWGLNHQQKPYEYAQSYKIENAPKLWEKTLNLPCSVGLKAQEIAHVCECCLKIQNEISINA